MVHYHLSVPLGGILFRDLHKMRELLTAEEYAALLKQIEVNGCACKSPERSGSVPKFV